MTFRGTIANRVLAGVLLVAYLAMFIAGTGHAVGHDDGDASSVLASIGASGVAGVDSKPLTHTSNHSDDGAETCFFCTHSPLVLLLLVLLLAFHIVLQHQYSPAPYTRRISLQGNALARLRAPPVIA